mmetsp:Transcript_65232/g.77218  ORF Transcript_65232/g.77218 Transcript_65232/m.77218 type:complete len:713 (-) Transcript_65232:17-2155(-)
MKFTSIFTGAFLGLFLKATPSNGSHEMYNLTGDLMTDMLLNHMMQCAGVEVEDDSCLMTSLVEIMTSSMTFGSNEAIMPSAVNDDFGGRRMLFGAGTTVAGHQERVRALSNSMFDFAKLNDMFRNHDFKNETDYFGNETYYFGNDTDYFGNETDYYGNETGYYGNETDYYEESCAPDPIPDEMLDVLLFYSQMMCLEKNVTVSQDEVDHLASQIQLLLNATECWESMCDGSFGEAMLFEYMEQCAHIDLPFPLPPPEVIENEPEVWKDDVTQACMLNFTMTYGPMAFGLTPPPSASEDVNQDQCIPPELDIMVDMCADVIAPQALEYCRAILDHPHETSSGDVNDDEDDAWKEGFSSIYGGSHSYDYSFSYHYDDDDNNDDNGDDGRQMIDFCNTITQLNTEKSRECFRDLCEMGNNGDTYDDDDYDDNDYDDDDYDNDDKDYYTNSSIYPTITPSNYDIATTSSPSAAPSAAPSAMPSAIPSAMPSMVPTMAQNIPSALPTVITSSPTPTPLNDAVEVKFEAGLTIGGLTKNDIPKTGPELKKMASVLVEVISEMLPPGSKARIISIGGIPVDGVNSLGSLSGFGGRNRRYRRYLEAANNSTTGNNTTDTSGDDVEIIFEVAMSVICDGVDCDKAKESSQTLYNTVTTEITTSVTDGSLATNIKQKASQSGVAILKNISIAADSFKAKEPVTVIKKASNTNNGGGGGGGGV